MRTTTASLAALIALGVPGSGAHAYTDGPTSEWFKALSSPYTHNCCDQSDCKLAKSDYRHGAWWALSNRTGKWVEIQANQITATVSIFNAAVLCEGDPFLYFDGPSAENPRYETRVYCFAPPPIGF
jgi:hypothetical protein